MHIHNQKRCIEKMIDNLLTQEESSIDYSHLEDNRAEYQSKLVNVSIKNEKKLNMEINDFEEEYTDKQLTISISEKIVAELTAENNNLIKLIINVPFDKAVVERAISNNDCSFGTIKEEIVKKLNTNIRLNTSDRIDILYLLNGYDYKSMLENILSNEKLNSIISNNRILQVVNLQPILMRRCMALIIHPIIFN